MSHSAGGKINKTYISTPRELVRELKTQLRPGQTYAGWIRHALDQEKRIRELEHVIEVQKKLLDRLEK